MYYRKQESAEELQRRLRLAEEEAAQLREAEERRRQEAIDERKARMRERQEAYYYEYRQADTWQEALRKQAELSKAEVTPGDPDDFFSQCGGACERALEIFVQEEVKLAPEIHALAVKIQELRRGMAHTVADRLAAEGSNYGWNSVVNSLRTIDEEPDQLAAWLQW